MNYKENTYDFIIENKRDDETIENETSLEFLHKLIDELDEEYYSEVMELLKRLPY